MPTGKSTKCQAPIECKAKDNKKLVCECEDKDVKSAKKNINK